MLLRQVGILHGHNVHRERNLLHGLIEQSDRPELHHQRRKERRPLPIPGLIFIFGATDETGPVPTVGVFLSATSEYAQASVDVEKDCNGVASSEGLPGWAAFTSYPC
jgi:hypothetical protein